MTLDWIALAALLLSIGSLGWQIADRVRLRPQLVLTLMPGTMSEERGGEAWEVGFVTLSAHAVNGRIGIRAVDFELSPRPDGFSYGQLPDPSGLSKMDLHNDRPALDNGDTATWSFCFHDKRGEPFRERVDVTARVTLVSGKVICSPCASLPPAMPRSDSQWILALVQAAEAEHGTGNIPPSLQARIKRLFNGSRDDDS